MMYWNKQTSFFWLFGIFFFSFLFFIPVYDDFKIRLLSLNATLILGLIWAWLASGSVQLQIPKVYRPVFWILLGIGLLLNTRQLMYGMPWRGDEDSNVDFVVIFSNLIPFQIFFLKCIALVVAAYLVVRFGKIKGVTQLLVAGVVLIIISYWAIHLNTINYYLSFQYNLIISRLPYLVRMLPVFPVTLGKFIGLQYQEWMYRIVPFLSAVVMAWIVATHYFKEQRNLAIATGIILLTLPAVFFYSSILYLEMTGVVLVCIVLLNSVAALSDDFDQIRQEPYWLALIAIGFVKETFIFFILVFLGIRFLNRVFLLKKISLKHLINEFCIALVLLIPIVYYLYIRNYNGNVRPGALSFEQLKHWSAYAIMLKSFWQQFGLFSLLYIAALFHYLFQKQFAKLLLMKLGLVFIVCMFAADSGGVYTGYSRFNLLVLPFFVIGGMDVLLLIYHKGKQLFYGAIAAVFLLNIVLCPIRLDGAKEAYWGDYGYDTAEHYYPFRAALNYTKEQGYTNVALLTNDYQAYFLRFSFQFAHLQYAPQFTISVNPALFDKQQAIGNVQSLLNSGVQAVILQIHQYDLTKKNTEVAPYLADLAASFSGCKVQVIQNEAHTLLVVSR